MSEVDIEIFQIAKTVVQEAEVAKWLTHVGANAETFLNNTANAEVSHPALAIALAAKRCYMSFEVGINPNITRVREDYVKYFDNILSSGHGSVLEHSTYSFAIEGVSRVFCYHPDTEILTKKGWKNISKITDNEIILTLNPETKQARWSINKKLHSFDYVGNLLYWQSKEDSSPKVTPDHTIWCCPRNLNKVNGLKAFEAMQVNGVKIPFNELRNKPFFIQNAIGEIENTNNSKNFVIGNCMYNAEHLMEWLGWVATDGTMTKPEDGFYITVNQSKEAGINRLSKLGKMLFGDRFKIYGKGNLTFRVRDKELYDWHIKLIGRLKSIRTLYPLYNFSSRLIKAFLKGAFAGDGCHGLAGHKEMACGGNLELAGDYQVLIAIAGRSSQVYVREDQIGQQFVLNGKITSNNLPAIYTSEHQRGEGASVVWPKNQREEIYSGKVFCPETEDGLVYVRQGSSKGKALWCGNTAELNRHRAGWAISEGSLRFIRFDKDIPYWLPTSLQPNSTDDPDLAERKARTRNIFASVFSESEAAYAELLDCWNMEEGNHNFDYKKKITSCLRRIIPLGVATGGVWTGNIRALRHVIAMRTSAAAEEEIFHVFSRIAEMMVKQEPLLFGDFNQLPSGGWEPTNWKV